MKRLFFNPLLIAPFLLLFATACGDNNKEQTADSEETLKETPAVCIWDGIALRESPSDKGQWISSISLGEKITLTGAVAYDSASNNREYRQVRLTDNKEGWVLKDFVAEGDVGTILKKADIFRRPDLLTKTDKAFEAMNVVAILSSQDDWAEVKGKREGDKWFTEGWIKAESLSSFDVDVAVAVYGSKALAKKSAEDQAEAIQEILDNSAFRDSGFIRMLEEKLEEFEEATNNTEVPEEESIEEEATKEEEPEEA